jgi:hypothetical protein
MRRIGFVSLFLLFLFPRASAPRNARDVVADIARTIGAANPNTIQYSGSGYIYFFGQSYEPGGPWPKFNSNSYTYLGNYEKGAAQEDMVRTQFENPERGSAGSVSFSADPRQKYIFVADIMNNVIWILNRSDGAVVGRIGHMGRAGGQFHWVHIAVTDSRGNLYTGEVETGKRIQKFIPLH